MTSLSQIDNAVLETWGVLSTDDMDPSLIKAVEEGSKTGSLTPILKLELKQKILHSRMKSGKGEIVLENDKPTGKRELTAEERRKKERRKEQNRRAAARCREKKKKISEKVLQEFINEQTEKRKLEMQVEQLKREKEALQRVLDEHAFTCVMVHTTPTPNQTPSYDDKTTFTFPSCSTSSNYPGETDFQRDNTTPFSAVDSCDEVFSCYGLSQLMYPSATEVMTQGDCAGHEMDQDELILPDDFLQFQNTELDLEELNGGRQSVSEYNEANFPSH